MKKKKIQEKINVLQEFYYMVLKEMVGEGYSIKILKKHMDSAIEEIVKENNDEDKNLIGILIVSINLALKQIKKEIK